MLLVLELNAIFSILKPAISMQPCECLAGHLYYVQHISLYVSMLTIAC